MTTRTRKAFDRRGKFKVLIHICSPCTDTGLRSRSPIARAGTMMIQTLYSHPKTNIVNIILHLHSIIETQTASREKWCVVNRHIGFQSLERASERASFASSFQGLPHIKSRRRRGQLHNVEGFSIRSQSLSNSQPSPKVPLHRQYLLSKQSVSPLHISSNSNPFLAAQYLSSPKAVKDNPAAPDVVATTRGERRVRRRPPAPGGNVDAHFSNSTSP